MIALLVLLVAVAAFCVSAVSGGGAGLILVPLLRLLLPMERVPAALSIGTAVGSLARIRAFAGSVRWDVVRWFAPAALPMAGLGAWALSRFEPAYVELLIGAFLLANLPALFRRRPPGGERHAGPPGRGRLVALGAAAGLISGFTGAVGLLFNRAYHRMGMRKEELVATRAANEVMVHLLKIALYGAFGLLDRSALATGAMIAGAAIAAAAIMRRLLPLVNEGAFRRVGDVAMVAAGAAMFTMSGGEVMAIHRAWVSSVRVGDDREFQLYWGGRRRFAIEREDDGWPALERTIPVGALAGAPAARARDLAKRGRIVQVEEVLGRHGRSYEIYVAFGSSIAKHEIAAE